LQVRQELGLADHVWTDKKKSIAQNLDDLGDDVGPAMRAGWLAYIHSVYGAEGAPDVSVIENDVLVQDKLFPQDESLFRVAE
jgi:hypothetical protein